MTALRIIGPFAFGYFLSYCFRNLNAVIAPDLTDALGLTAGTLGLLTSAYFFSFAAFQLPLGVLLDRYGPRRVEAVLLVVAGAGALLFAYGSEPGTLVFARALIGLGVSACLMASFKATTLWFAPGRQPLVNGVILSCGGLGALAATQPVELLLAYIGWRELFVGLGGLAFAAAAVILFAVPRREEEGAAQGGSLQEQVLGIGHILRSPVFWRIAPLPVFSQSAFMAIQGLWAGPWLKDVAGFDRAGVAHHLVLIPAAMTAGFLSLGFIAERLDRVGFRTVHVATAGVLIAMTVLVVLVLDPQLAPAPLWMAFGFFGTAGILYYPALTREFPRALSGRVLTTLNVLTFSGAFACQWGIGVVIEFWPAPRAGAYLPAGYASAFSAVVAIQVAAAVWLLWPREARVSPA